MQLTVMWGDLEPGRWRCASTDHSFVFSTLLVPLNLPCRMRLRSVEESLRDTYVHTA